MFACKTRLIAFRRAFLGQQSLCRWAVDSRDATIDDTPLTSVVIEMESWAGSKDNTDANERTAQELHETAASLLDGTREFEMTNPTESDVTL